MRLKLGAKNAFARCTESVLDECGGGSESAEGRVVVVGVKLDGKSKELLTWALVKVAQCGDRVVALHVLAPNTDKGDLLSLVKEFDSVLAAYEGFCNLKQIDLKLKVCRGTPVRKILAREVKSCGATSLILGPSEIPHTIRSVVSVAKSCAKSLPKSVSVIAVDNGKVLFQRQATSNSLSELENFEVTGKSCKRRKLVSKSRLSLPSSSVLNEDSCSDIVDNSMALVLYNSPDTPLEEPESIPGWTFLRRVFRHRNASENSSPKKSIMKKWFSRLPGGQSFGAIYTDEKHKKSNDDDDDSDLDSESSTVIVVGSVPNNAPDCDDLYMLPKELDGLSQKYSSMCRLFLYHELVSATSNFQPENLIGRGGSSRVYRGCLPDETELAVKILKPSEDALKQYVSEIEIVTSLNHMNIISLYGFCYEDNKLLLVYNLIERGSLEENLHGANKLGSSLGWTVRYKVALGVAEALDHLHNSCTNPIIHRDVKSSNILLLDDFEPQLSDFGLATSASNSSCMESYDVAGTFGYLAPEYFMHGRLDEKIDVYAFGVVLLELLSGRKPIDNKNQKGQESLVMWAKQILRCGKTSQLLDPDLCPSYDHDQFENMVLAATLCIRQAPGLRPNMSKVLKLLQGDREVVNWAKQQVTLSEVTDAINNEQSPRKIESFLNLALLNLDDDTISTSSTDQMISVEDYLQGRWSRTSSFE